MMIFIDDGKMFEGSFEQFEDCFFSFRPEDCVSNDTKLAAIRAWCVDHEFKMRVVSRSRS